MPETSNLSKEEIYSLLEKQVSAMVEDESDAVANMANVAALIHHSLKFWWTGFYRVDGNQLVLGPFQGPVACTRIPFRRGVCGSARKAGETIVVPDVDQFPGHIACSSASRSEIVVPVRKDGEIWGVLDIDSAELNTFDDTDRIWLEKIVEHL